jgi:hypothetical protein
MIRLTIATKYQSPVALKDWETEAFAQHAFLFQPGSAAPDNALPDVTAHCFAAATCRPLPRKRMAEKKFASGNNSKPPRYQKLVYINF